MLNSFIIIFFVLGFITLISCLFSFFIDSYFDSFYF